MPRNKSRNDFYKCVFVGIALMLLIICSNFATGASSSSPPQTSPTVRSPAFLEYVSLSNNSKNIVVSGLLVDGLNQKPIANATINIVDSRNLTVYGHATTNESGRFAFNFPLNEANLSIKAVFAGDSQHKEYTSDTVNKIIPLTPTPQPTVPEFPTLMILPAFASTIILSIVLIRTKTAKK